METFFVFLRRQKIRRMKYFETVFLEEANTFVASLDAKAQKKVFYNIRIAEQTNDPKLFKKLTDEIWEFRTYFNRQTIRILAFWDKTSKIHTLVMAASGFVKKTKKTPSLEIDRAKRIREKYYTDNKL